MRVHTMRAALSTLYLRDSRAFPIILRLNMHSVASVHRRILTR